MNDRISAGETTAPKPEVPGLKPLSLFEEICDFNCFEIKVAIASAASSISLEGTMSKAIGEDSRSLDATASLVALVDDCKSIVSTKSRSKPISCAKATVSSKDADVPEISISKSPRRII